MGQKVHPVGFRLAVNKDWESKWYAAPKEYADQLHQDLSIRRYLKNRLQKGAISRVVIERAWNSIRVTLHTSRPGLIIGKRGAEIEIMTNQISKLCGNSQVKIDIHEIRQPELDAQWIAAQVATQLERRINFRRAMKRAIQTAMDFGAEGIRIRCAGRLQGGDIARAENYRQGKVPLQTLRVPIQYGFAEAETVWGIIGVKVWLNKKEDADSKDGNKGQQRRGRGGRRGGDRRGGGGDRRGGGNRGGGDRRGGGRPQAGGGGRPQGGPPAGGGDSKPPAAAPSGGDSKPPAAS